MNTEANIYYADDNKTSGTNGSSLNLFTLWFLAHVENNSY